MAETSIRPDDMSSGEVEDIRTLGTFEQVQHSALSEPVTKVRPATMDEFREWYTKAIKDATSDSPPEKFASLKIGVGLLPGYEGSQKAEWDCTENMITSIEASDWHPTGGQCEFNALPVYRRSEFKNRNGPLECLKYFILLSGFYNLSWVYLPTRRTTIAVLRCYTTIGEYAVRGILQALKSDRSSLAHPLHIGIIHHEHITHHCRDNLLAQRRNINKAQFLTGFHFYADVTRAQADLKNNGISKASFDLVSSATVLSSTEDCSKGAIDLARFFLGENEHFAIFSHRSGLPVDDCLQYEIDQAAKRCLRRAEALANTSIQWQKTASVVMQGLFNLIAQRDQNASLAIAEATKRDSTSMKSIAAVTMIFLPATFTASLFATPWFAESQVPFLAHTDHFWVYWIVTIPVTISTLTCWAVWIRYVRQMEMQVDAKTKPTTTRKWMEIMKLGTKMKDVEEVDGGEEDAAEEEKTERPVLPFYKHTAKHNGAARNQDQEMDDG